MAVHTILKKNEVIEILKKYNLGTLVKYNGIKEGIENTNYFLETTKNKFILTIYENRVLKEEIPFYLDLMNFSNKEGINCPTVVNNKVNKNLFDYKNKKCAIFTFLKGKCLNTWNKENCFNVGNKLAEFHEVNKKFSEVKKNHYGINGWKELYVQCEGKMNNIIKNLNEIVADEINYLEKNWPKNLPSGIIHADLFPDNVLFDKNKISGIIDFYFSCYDIFIYDLAISINAWCFDENNFDKDKFSSLIQGYQKKRELTKKEKGVINICLRGASVRFLMTRIFDCLYKNKLNEKDPYDYLKRLNFHRSLKFFEDYFE